MAGVDIRRQNFKVHRDGFVDENRQLVEVADLARDQGGHELGRVVGFEVGGLVGDDAVAGAVRFVESVAGELGHGIEDAAGFPGIDIVGGFAAGYEFLALLFHDRLLLLTHGAA